MNEDPLRAVDGCQLKAGTTGLSSVFKGHWWELTLACGHVVERSIRWRKISNPPRGWAALHHPPSLSRLPDPPKRARCEVCASDAPRS